MQILVILGHPNPESFNHAIANRVCRALENDGHDVTFHDLYAEKFESIITKEELFKKTGIPSEINSYCTELQAADGIIIIHPNWWGQPPAILKGWVDRVLRPGTAYNFIEGDSGEGIPVGLLNAQAVLVLNTSNTHDKREQETFGDPLELLWKNCIFDLCGVHRFHRRMFNVIVTSSDEQRKQWLDEAAKLTHDIFKAGPC